MDRLNATIDAVNVFAWGPSMLGILGVTGMLLTLGLVFMPWRKVGYGFRLLFDKGRAVGEGGGQALQRADDRSVGHGRHREHRRRRHRHRAWRTGCHLLHVAHLA